MFVRVVAIVLLAFATLYRVLSDWADFMTNFADGPFSPAFNAFIGALYWTGFGLLVAEGLWRRRATP